MKYVQAQSILYRILLINNSSQITDTCPFYPSYGLVPPLPAAFGALVGGLVGEIVHVGPELGSAFGSAAAVYAIDDCGLGIREEATLGGFLGAALGSTFGKRITPFLGLTFGAFVCTARGNTVDNCQEVIVISTLIAMFLNLTYIIFPPASAVFSAIGGAVGAAVGSIFVPFIIMILEGTNIHQVD